MRRFITSFAFALSCSALVANAQETTTKTETKTSGDSPQVITYTGCVQTGTQAKTYVLDKVVPVTKTTTTETPTSSTTTSSTSYVLVPGESVTVQEHVGQKVEVTGTLIPGGDSAHGDHHEDRARGRGGQQDSLAHRDQERNAGIPCDVDQDHRSVLTAPLRCGS